MVIIENDSPVALNIETGSSQLMGNDRAIPSSVFIEIVDKFSAKLLPILSKRDLMGKQISSMLEAESIKLKHNLTFSQKSEAVIMIPGSFSFYNFEIQKGQFEAMIKEYIDAICLKIEDIVKNANIQMKDIDRVLLVGGSSRIPYVEEMVKKTTGRPICKDVDTELVVCYGAAI